MGFFDTLSAPTAPAPAAVPATAPGASSGSFFDALSTSATPVTRSVRPAAAPKNALQTPSQMLPQDFGDTLGQGIVHGLAAAGRHGMHLASDLNRWTGLSGLEHALEPQSLQSALGRAQQAATPNPAHYPAPGAGGAIGNVLGQMAPALAGGEAVDAASQVPEGAGMLANLLGRSIPVNAAMGALTPHVNPALGAGIGAVAGPLVEGATNLASQGVARAGDFAAPLVQRGLQFLRKPTTDDAANAAAAYARTAVKPEDIEAVRAAQEPVPGVTHPPAVLAHSDPMQAQLSALRTRTAGADNPVDAQHLANLQAIHAHIDTHVPEISDSRPAADSSADMLAHLGQAKSAARDVAAADRAPLDAVKPHVHVALDGLKKAYDNVTDTLGVHTRALLPDWLRQTFDGMPLGAKTSYQNAESIISRLNAEAAKAPADTTTNAILAKMRAGMKDALFNSTKFYDESGTRLPADYEGAVKDAQALANKSWRGYRDMFPSRGSGALTPAKRFIADATQGKVNPSEFGARVLSHPEYLDAWKNAISKPEAGTGQELVNNASGDSAASAEAVSRHDAEQARGRYRYIINNDRSVTPLYGVDAADTNAARGQVIVQRGIGDKPYTVLSHGTDMAPARAQQIAESMGDKLDDLSAKGGFEDDEARAAPKGKPGYDIRGARDAIRARMDALDAPRQPDEAGVKLAREHYARRLRDTTYDTRGRALDQTPLVNGTKMRDFRGAKTSGLGWAEKQLFKPEESQALDQAQEALIRNNQRYASVGKGQSPTEYLRQLNKNAEVHPFVHVGAALSGHGIAPVALTKGYELLSNRYAAQLQPMVDEQLTHILTDPAAFLDAMGRQPPEVKASLMSRLKGSAGAKATTRGAGHAAAMLGALAGR